MLATTQLPDKSARDYQESLFAWPQNLLVYSAVWVVVYVLCYHGYLR